MAKFGELSEQQAQNTIRDAFIEALKNDEVKKIFGGSGSGGGGGGGNGGGQPPVTTTQVLKCYLYKYNSDKSTIEHAFDANDIYAEIVSISREGSPWYTSPGCENKNVYYGVK